MSIEIVSDRNSTWAIDWALVGSIVRSYTHSEAILKHSRRVESGDVNWFNPFSWARPEVVTFEVDWPKALAAKSERAEVILRDLYAGVQVDVPQVRAQLEQAIAATTSNEKVYRDQWTEATRETSRNIDVAVATYEGSAEAARIVRDVSFDTVLVGATLMSGGTAAAFTMSGSLLKGAATYQDTGSVGAAAVETSASIILTAIPISQRANGKVAVKTLDSVIEEGTIVLLDAHFEVAKSLAAGKDLDESLLRGGVKVVAGAASPVMADVIEKAAASEPIRRLLAQAAIPAQIIVETGGKDVEVTTGLVGNVGAMLVSTQGLGRIPAVVLSEMSTSEREHNRELLSETGNSCFGSQELCGSMKVLERAIQPAISVA